MRKNLHRATLAVLTVMLSLATCMGLAGCAGDDDPIVMTVGDSELHASVVEEYLAAVKVSIGSDTDAAFEAYVSDQGLTVDEYWQNLLDYYGEEMAVTEKCSEMGIEATDDEIAEARETYWTYFGVSSDEEYEESLAGLGLSVESMDATLAYNVCLKKLYEQEVPIPEPTDAEIQAYANLYRSSYESVRFSLIYKPAGSLMELQTVLKELQDTPGADFSAYAREYSDSLSMTDEDGDTGWILTSALSSSFSEVLGDLAVGDILDEVCLIDDGLYIIKKTGAYEPEEDDDVNVDLAAMPDEVYAQLLQDVTDYLWSEQCSEYVDGLYEQADVTIFISSYYDLPTQE